MLTTQVDNFPGFSEGVLGPDLMLEMRKQAERFGVKVIEENANELNLDLYPFVVKTRKNEYKGKSLIIATGAEPRWLGVPGEEKLKGRGVSVCAPCDAPFFKNQKVIVVGGGDSAMEEAIVLSEHAREVIIVHRRGELKASKIMQDRALGKKNVSVMWYKKVIEIKGKNKVEGVVLEDTRTGKRQEIQVDGVFVAIGHIPNTHLLQGKVEITDKGLVKTFGLTQTSKKGVFVAGDLTDWNWSYRQAITAAGSGCMAGMDALRFLREKEEL